MAIDPRGRPSCAREYSWVALCAPDHGILPHRCNGGAMEAQDDAERRLDENVAAAEVTAAAEVKTSRDELKTEVAAAVRAAPAQAKKIATAAVQAAPDELKGAVAAAAVQAAPDELKGAVAAAAVQAAPDELEGEVTAAAVQAIVNLDSS